MRGTRHRILLCRKMVTGKEQLRHPLYTLIALQAGFAPTCHSEGGATEESLHENPINLTKHH